MASFTWVGGADINGANNWITPADWLVGGLPTATIPNSAADTATVNSDPGGRDAIISGGQAITLGSLSIDDSGVAGVAGGHVIVGGSPEIGGGGGGSLTSLGAITVISTNSGGGLVGGLGAMIIAPTLTLSAPNVVIGGGGVFNIATGIVNNGEIQADGGDFALGKLVLTTPTISGTGFIEVDGPSSMEINAATAQPLRVSTNPGQTASVIFDQPAAFTGSLSLLTSNTTVDLFFMGQTPTDVSYNADTRTLVITGTGGAIIDTIPIVGNGTSTFSVIPSTSPGYGEIAITPTNTGILPQIPAPIDGISTSTLSSADLSQLLQGNQSSMRFVAGTEAITLVDGTLSVGPDTNEAFLTRLYEGLLGRGPDENGISAWDAALKAGTTQSAIAQAFVNSPEFQAAHPGQDDTSFLAGLYKGLLGRDADAAGLASWNAVLAAGGSRGDVTVGFANSAEAKQVWSGVTSLGVFAHDPNSAIVREDYIAGLGRDAEAGGLAAWTNLLNNGVTPVQLAQSIAASPEFQALHGAQSDTDYVNSVYQNALGRSAEPAGLAAWTNALQAGGNRGDVMAAIGQSPEAQGHLQWALQA